MATGNQRGQQFPPTAGFEIASDTVITSSGKQPTSEHFWTLTHLRDSESLDFRGSLTLSKDTTDRFSLLADLRSWLLETWFTKEHYEGRNDNRNNHVQVQASNMKIRNED